MTPSELMQALADAGAPMAAIIIAVRAIEEKDAILAAKRATERDRKRKQRGTVTGQSRDTAGTVTPEPSPLGSPPKVSPDPYKEPPLNTPQPELIVARDPIEILGSMLTAWLDDFEKRLPAPNGVTAGQWRDFVKLRKAKRQPLMAGGYWQIVKKLKVFAEDGYPPGDMVNLALERGWTTVHKPTGDTRNGTHQPNSGQPNGLRGSRPNPALDLVRSAEAQSAAERGDQAADRGAWLALPPSGSG